MPATGNASTMRAIVCDAYGPPGSLKIGHVARPDLAADEVRIRTVAAGINFPDSLIIKGAYQLKPPLPFVPGFEVAGEVIEVGSTVSAVRVGQRVMALTSSGYGAFAQEATARAAEVVPVPDSMEHATAIALFTAYGTAYHGLVQRGQLRSGETLVVLGASGGVGLAAVELGKAIGATVIAVARSRSRCATAAEMGADHVIGYAEEDVRKRVLELTQQRGADVCIDMLGGEPFHAMSRAMNWNGRLLVVGFTTGDIPKLPANLVLLKGYQLVGVYWGGFLARQPAANAENFKTLAEWVAQGRITPRIAARYPLEQVPVALDDLLSRRVSGKLVIDISPEAIAEAAA